MNVEGKYSSYRWTASTDLQSYKAHPVVLPVIGEKIAGLTKETWEELGHEVIEVVVLTREEYGALRRGDGCL